MGVMYHAHARFFDRKGNKITIPSPVDPLTPNAPFWYDYISMNAKTWADAGFSAVMFPPVSKTQSGHYPTGDGYGVFDHYDIGSKLQCGSVETRFGDREQLQRAVAICHANGMDVYADAVMHQLSGANAGDGTYRYLGANNVRGIGRFPKNPGNFRGNPPRRPDDPVPVPYYDFAFGDEFVYKNCEPSGYTINGMIDWGDWLTRSLGIDGYRVDDTKGTWAPFVHEWMTSKSMRTRFCTAEYFDGDPAALAWWCQNQMGGRSSVYDFTLHWALQAMCNGADMRIMEGAGYAARDPFHAVTFVDNPDTDTSPGQQIIGSKLLAYAFILTTEGYPAVYHKDYAQETGCYGLKPWIDELVWIHENLANGATTTRYIDDRAIVLERLGDPGLITAISNDPFNARTITCATNHPPGRILKDYTGKHSSVVVRSNGTITFTVPSNYFGNGQSYLCFAPGGVVGRKLKPRMATQQFYGAADLDIGPLTVDPVVPIPGIYCEANTKISFELETPAAVFDSAPEVTLSLISSTGQVVGAAGWPAPSPKVYSFTASRTGMYNVKLSAPQLAAPAPFALLVQYQAPTTYTKG